MNTSLVLHTVKLIWYTYRYTYLSTREQRVKINSQVSGWSNILVGIPQGSILGPHLFSIHISYSISQTDDFDMAIYVLMTTRLMSAMTVYWWNWKRRDVRREIIFTREELHIFFGRIHLYFPLIRNKSLFFFKPQNCIFPRFISRNGTYEVTFSVNFWRFWRTKYVT